MDSFNAGYLLFLGGVEGFDIHFILISESIFIQSETPLLIESMMCVFMSQLTIYREMEENRDFG